MPKHANRKSLARRIAMEQGIKYTQALRQLENGQDEASAAVTLTARETRLARAAGDIATKLDDNRVPSTIVVGASAVTAVFIEAAIENTTATDVRRLRMGDFADGGIDLTSTARSSIRGPEVPRSTLVTLADSGQDDPTAREIVTGFVQHLLRTGRSQGVGVLVAIEHPDTDLLEWASRCGCDVIIVGDPHLEALDTPSGHASGAYTEYEHRRITGESPDYQHIADSPEAVAGLARILDKTLGVVVYRDQVEALLALGLEGEAVGDASTDPRWELDRHRGIELGAALDSETPEALVWDTDVQQHLRLLGPAGAGRSWLAAQIVNQAARAGHRSIYVDVAKTGVGYGTPLNREAVEHIKTQADALQVLAGIDGSTETFVVIDLVGYLLEPYPRPCDDNAFADALSEQLLRLRDTPGVHLITDQQVVMPGSADLYEAGSWLMVAMGRLPKINLVAAGLHPEIVGQAAVESTGHRPGRGIVITGPMTYRRLQVSSNIDEYR